MLDDIVVGECWILNLFGVHEREDVYDVGVFVFVEVEIDEV